MISNKPQKISIDTWYYENKGSIEIIHKGDTIKITWSKLLKSLKRNEHQMEKIK